jgi:CDP-paratose 2-epimerase
MVKILVTGGAGFIGSHAAEFYAKKDDEVTILDNLSRDKLLNKEIKNKDFNWDYLKKYPNIKHIKADITNPEDIEKAAKDQDFMCFILGYFFK